MATLKPAPAKRRARSAPIRFAPPVIRMLGIARLLSVQNLGPRLREGSDREHEILREECPVRRSPDRILWTRRGGNNNRAFLAVRDARQKRTKTQWGASRLRRILPPDASRSPESVRPSTTGKSDNRPERPRVPWRRHAPEARQPGRRVSTRPVVCLGAMPNRTFTVRPGRIAASVQMGCGPCMPVGLPAHVLSGSHPIIREPGRVNASARARRVLILSVGSAGLLMPSSHHAGFPGRNPSRAFCNGVCRLCHQIPAPKADNRAGLERPCALADPCRQKAPTPDRRDRVPGRETSPPPRAEIACA